MKKLRVHIEQYFDRLDDRFRALPLKKQRQFTLYFFMGYLLLTAAVIWNVWYDVATSNEVVNIKHIENPVHKKKETSTRLQDTLSTFKQ